jgi:tRNA (mo5U34)-methyltransferase
MSSQMDVRNEIEQVKWFHRLDLGNGIVTPGLYQGLTLDQLQLPHDLSGQTVLDIGAWDGHYSFMVERAGAQHVLATDRYVWENWATGKRGFEVARAALNSQIEDQTIDVMDLSPETVGVFDIVLFLGVLYHLRYPALAIDRLLKVTGKLMVLETHVDLTSLDRPAAAFYPGNELGNDATNWWGPNPACVEGLLRTAGFTDVKTISVWLPNKGFPGPSGEQGRAIFHARP